ncbi:MAG: AAA family ATPase [Candidatus Nomurabacteria bacterium]|nr:MAG: AAA family ATPase [Candidatus Nomurabacteria bacterium]
MKKKTPKRAQKNANWSFPHFIGNEQVCQYLQNVQQSGSLHHAYLFTGPAQVGKTTLAQIFAHHILNDMEATLPWPIVSSTELSSHTDFVGFSAAEFSGVEDVRKIVQAAQQSPLRAKHRVVLMSDIDALSESAMNALLKAFEDAPPKTLFLCTSSHPQLLLSTLRSRCQQIPLQGSKDAQLEEHLLEHFSEKKRTRDIVALAEGRPGLLTDWVNDSEALDAAEQLLENIRQLRTQSLHEKHQFVTTLFKGVKEFSEKQEIAARFLHYLVLDEKNRLFQKDQTGQKLQAHRVKHVRKALQGQKLLRQNTQAALLLEDLLLTYV